MPSSKLSAAISEYIADRSSIRLEKLDKEAEKKRSSLATDPDALYEWEATYTEQRQLEIERYSPANWLDAASGRAKQINLVTHALKYSHSDAKGSSLFSLTKSEKEGYLGSGNLMAPKLDVVGNAAALDVANLLLLQADGVRLIDLLSKGDASPLQPFAKNEEQLSAWLHGFRQALQSRDPSSHKLAKQIYFPVAAHEYHLLGPLFSSALTQACYERVNNSRFSDSAKEARKARADKRPHQEVIVDYPQLAIQTFGGTKPQNISLLNSQRGGKAYLLNCQPPHWHTRVTPPAHSNAFWGQYARQSRPVVNELKTFLIAVSDKDSNVKIRNRRKKLLATLVADLHQLAARYQSLAAGWSLASDISTVEKYWLDPRRADTAFVDGRAATDWQQEIAQYFGQWLNKQLQHKKLSMKDVESNEWAGQLERELRLLREDMEAMV